MRSAITKFILVAVFLSTLAWFISLTNDDMWLGLWFLLFLFVGIPVFVLVLLDLCRTVGAKWPASQKRKAMWRAGFSCALLILLFAIAWRTEDISARAVAMVFAAILGFPFVLLSLIDVGRALRAEARGNHRATWLVWVLSHLQAALGATCMAAVTYVLYRDVIDWLDGTADFRGVMLLLWIPMGVGMIFVGFKYIQSAFQAGGDK